MKDNNSIGGTKMIRLLRRLCFILAASAFHYMTIIRTHVQDFHLSSQLSEENIIVLDDSTHSEQRFTSPANARIFLNGRVQRQLPMFNITGGIIIFIHIAKTGGSSIREGFRKLPNISVKRIMNEAQLNGKQEQIDWYLSLNNNRSQINGGREKVLLLEIHGHHGEPMPIFQMHPHIQHWKAQADKNKKNIFIFTLFRETVAFHLSYFTFFRHPNCQELWCDRPVLPQTEAYLVQSMIPNHQCQYLARKFNKTTRNDATVGTRVSKVECESVQTLLQQNVDWIGTTDSLSTTTLPLLTFMVAGNATIAQDFPIANRQNVKKKLQLRNISIDAIRHIRQASNYDHQLYDMARREYTIDMWNNFVAT